MKAVNNFNRYLMKRKSEGQATITKLDPSPHFLAILQIRHTEKSTKPLDVRNKVKLSFK